MRCPYCRRYRKNARKLRKKYSKIQYPRMPHAYMPYKTGSPKFRYGFARMWFNDLNRAAAILADEFEEVYITWTWPRTNAHDIEAYDTDGELHKFYYFRPHYRDSFRRKTPVHLVIGKKDILRKKTSEYINAITYLPSKGLITIPHEDFKLYALRRRRPRQFPLKRYVDQFYE